MIEITDQNFAEHTQQGDVIVKFWAPWCGPCKSLGPSLDALAEEFKDSHKFASVNVDDTSLASKFAIRGIPTLVYLRNGETVSLCVGSKTKDQIRDWIEQNR